MFDEQTTTWFSETIGTPTAVQEEGWPMIESGRHVLISAPTGTGKTLASFLVFIDRMKAQSRRGELPDELSLIYISPLKALGNDIRENLRRPLDGIDGAELRVGIRTGDTTAYERRRMIKKPPHILITTPESLYLLLTSKSGREMLKTAKTVILDELHAVINTKRGAHLMLSLARLDKLCGAELQRVGLSATIEPLDVAAEYLAPGKSAAIVAPKMAKSVDIQVTSPLPDFRVLTEGTIWADIAREVHEHCLTARTVIAFTDARNNAEKLAYYVNQIAPGFARTHHGCVSKEQRLEAERQIRSGELRLMCATSSMELGIDVGEVDLVLQVGCPRTISSTMQRLGRAGHNPGRTSVMYIYPRTAAEAVNCGLTAGVALDGGIEQSTPPRKCLDVLAQHLVSMAVEESYDIEEILELLPNAYNFRDVTREELLATLEMLAGDYEHELDRPARPRILYDRINGRVEGDAYSRMLALNAGGTIPDRGFYAVKLPNGTKLGELDEEFVFEARVGDKFLLGAFGWRIAEIRKDDVLVTQASTEGAQSPWWHGDAAGRGYATGKSFGALMRSLSDAHQVGRLHSRLRELCLDEAAAYNARRFLESQIEATGCLPDDRTIIVEHFSGEYGESQIMVHSLFGRRVNAGLSLLMQHAASNALGCEISAFDDDDGFIISPYASAASIPEGLMHELSPDTAAGMLTSMLPATPLFNMAYRYNAARALMMGLRSGKRQPLWVQRLRSAEGLDNAIRQRNHPLIAETRRECLEDYWDLPSIEGVLRDISEGRISVVEVKRSEPSPMSLPLRRQAEAVMMYDYHPTSSSVTNHVAAELAEMTTPAPEELERAGKRRREPENAAQLHSLLMAEGDLFAGEVDVPVQWLDSLAREGRVLYIEPGLWICAEQEEQYRAAFEDGDVETRKRIARRCLRYRGAQNAESLSERYFLTEEQCRVLLEALTESKEAVYFDELYYHAELYSRAGRETVAARRREVKTRPPEAYAAMSVSRARTAGDSLSQLRQGLTALLGQSYPPSIWESVLLPARTSGYRPKLLDELLSQGEFLWVLSEGGLSFHSPDDVDWEGGYTFESTVLDDEDENAVVDALEKRGASFLRSLLTVLPGNSALDTMLKLTAKGCVRADSFDPIRRLIQGDSKNLKRRAMERSVALTSGRWELTRLLKPLSIEDRLERGFDRALILSRETAKGLSRGNEPGISWGEALEVLRIWEYTGKARRGYFVEGLDGAQFVRADDYRSVVSALEHPTDGIVWLNATDPAMQWGKSLPHMSERAFINVAGTAVALSAGVPIALFERKGQVLRVFEPSRQEEALTVFARDYAQRRIFPDQRRMTVKEYPADAESALEGAGFKRQMLEYTLWERG